jgi:hypothetical protein
VIDFGAARDGEPECKRGRRIVVDESGREVINDDEERFVDMDGPSDH